MFWIWLSLGYYKVSENNMLVGYKIGSIHKLILVYRFQQNFIVFFPAKKFTLVIYV